MNSVKNINENNFNPQKKKIKVVSIDKATSMGRALSTSKAMSVPKGQRKYSSTVLRVTKYSKPYKNELPEILNQVNQRKIN